mgnify:CR=1 FL=1
MRDLQRALSIAREQGAHAGNEAADLRARLENASATVGQTSTLLEETGTIHIPPESPHLSLSLSISLSLSLSH